MHLTNYSVLYSALLEDFEVDEFILIRKNKRKLKLLKMALNTSYAMLASAAFIGSSEIGFAVIVAALILIFYFQAKIKRCLEMIEQDNESIELSFRKYVNTSEVDDFRNIQYKKMVDNSISKAEYLHYLREETSLHFSLVKKECIEGVNIDVVNYKSGIEKLFDIAYKSVEEGYLQREEVDSIKRKWICDLQVLCNQYAGTDVEVELKYLYVKSGAIK